MNLRKQYLKNNDCYKAGRKIKPKGIMVHSTGANNPNVSRYVPGWDKPGLNKCVHAFIGKLEDGSIGTVQTLPWDHRGWHCGSSGNNTHIGFEICEDGLEDASYFKAVYREAVELTAMLCEKYDLDPHKAVICHAEGYQRGIASNHADVLHWFPRHGKTMDDFRKDVAAEMGGEQTVTIDLPILKKGSKGASVRSLQQLLTAKGYDTKGIDGSFGANTDAAFRKFQKAMGLTVDGSCGIQSWTALLKK